MSELQNTIKITENHIIENEVTKEPNNEKTLDKNQNKNKESINKISTDFKSLENQQSLNNLLKKKINFNQKNQKKLVLN